MTPARPAAGDADRLVTVGRYGDPIAAELARSRLESDGLAVFIQGGGLGSLLPTAVVYPILLQVRAEDADRAEEILADSTAEAAFPGEPEGGEQPGRAEGS